MKLDLNKLFNAASMLPALFGLLCVAFLMYVYWWPLDDGYFVHRPLEHEVTYDAGTGSIRIHRYYCVTGDMPVTISRDLISISSSDNAQVRVSLPTTVQIYENGCHSIDRIFDIPKSVPAGNYRVVNVATWKANPFREGTTKLPELYVAIPSQ